MTVSELIFPRAAQLVTPLALRVAYVLRVNLRRLALLILLTSGATHAFAQAQNTGTIAGNILDSQSAVVPGATVVLTSIDTAQTTTTKANEKGEYLFTDVKIGTYMLRVTAPTFSAYEVDLIAVDADQNVRQDAKLARGAATETITVQADSNIIDTRSATIGTMIDKNLVESLPIDGENIVSLSALLPGVSNVNAPTTFTSDTGGPTYSVSGSRSNQNLFLLDGAIWNNAFYNTGLNYPPRLALQEVSVLLNNFKAQYGRNSGSVFNVLTRAGSNTIHGTLWEYYQSSGFDAADYISGLLPHLVENQFGAAIGGPIKRDRAFFFLTYQDLRLAGQLVAEDPTPTYVERGLDAPGVPHQCTSTGLFVGMTCADFSSQFPAGTAINKTVTNPIYIGGSNTQAQIQNAWIQSGHTGTSPCVSLLQPTAATEYLPYPELPTVCFNPVSVNFLNKYIPFATQYFRGIQLPGSQPIAYTVANQPRNDQEGLARFDLNLPWRHTIDARTFITNASDFTSNSVQAATDQGIANYEQTYNSAVIYHASIGDTWVVTPSMLNVARFAYKRFTYNINPSDPTTWSDLGASYIQPAAVKSLPEVEMTDQFTAGSANSGYSYTLTANYEADDNLSYTKGNHSINLGAQFLAIQYIHRFDQVPFFQSEQQQTKTEIGDFLLGLTYNEVVGNFTNLAAIQHDLYLYAQDDWRATSRLTINFGLRYELPFAWKEKDGEGTTFIPGYKSQVFANAPAGVAYQGDPGVSTTPKTRYDNWGPRLGLVYDVFGNGNSSIRAGFGIFYNAINANTVGVGEPYHYTVNYSTPAGGFSIPLAGQPAIPAQYTPGNPQFALPFTINYADPHNVTPYVMATNLGFQQRINKAGTLEVNYVGKFSRHDMILYDQNPAIVDCSGGYYQANPVYCVIGASSTVGTSNYTQRVKYPNFNYGGQGIVDNATIGTSNYNGLQVIYKQSTPRGNIYGSYTWARALDVGSEGTTTLAHVPDIAAGLRSQFGPSDFNATHILNLGWSLKLPQFRRGSYLTRSILSDWTVGGIYNARSGNPINITYAGDVSFTDDRPQRPSLVPGVSPKLPSNRHRSDKILEWFNTAAFEKPCGTGVSPTACVTYGTFGNVTRNSVIGPGYINLNADVQKRFQLPGEGRSLELKLDGFNVFNTPNLSVPGTQLASSASSQNNFGIITATVGTNGVVGSNGRRLQLSGILRF